MQVATLTYSVPILSSSVIALPADQKALLPTMPAYQDRDSKQFWQRRNSQSLHSKTFTEIVTDITNEKSVTSLGILVDNFMGWGGKKSLYRRGIETVSELISTLENKATPFFQRSVKPVQAKAKDEVKASSRRSAKQDNYWIINGTYGEIIANQEFPQCHSDWFGTYSQYCIIESSATFEEIGENSNNPEQFGKSFPRCLDEMVVEQYFTAVNTSYAGQTCLFDINPGIYVGGLPVGNQTLNFDIYAASYAFMFQNQSRIPISQELIDGCYTANLEQGINEFDPQVNIGKEEASGRYNLNYPATWCTSAYVLQNWTLVPPRGSERISMLYEPYFMEQYLKCSTEKVESYFQGIEKNASCAALNTSQNVLVYPLQIGSEYPNGNFTITAAGFVSSQADSQFINAAIQACYTQSYADYEQHRKIGNTVMAGAAFLLTSIAGGALLYYVKVYKRRKEIELVAKLAKGDLDTLIEKEDAMDLEASPPSTEDVAGDLPHAGEDLPSEQGRELQTRATLSAIDLIIASEDEETLLDD